MPPVARFAPTRAFLAAIACLAIAAAHAQSAPPESRLALVIGNAAYASAPLANPVNDAKAISSQLRGAGFEVIELHNLGTAGMRRAIRDFGERLKGKSVGLFYFAGHGVQVAGRNYLIPVGADIQVEDEVEDQSVDASLVLAKMSTSKTRTNLVILDACRNNPYGRGSRSNVQGLAPMDAPVGTLVAFSTSPGQVASDGSGANGLYTQFLLREMGQPQKVEDVFKRVRAAVRVASAGRQIPWENTSLEGDFYFRAPAVADGAADEARRQRAQREEIERAVTDAVGHSKREAEVERARLEKSFEVRLAAEREKAQREAISRIAATERDAREASEKPATLAAFTPASPAAAPAIGRFPPPGEDSVRARIEAMLEQGREGGPVLLAATGNYARGITDDVARGKVPPPLKTGDRRIYQVERKDYGAIRRSYTTETVVIAADGGHEIVSDGGMGELFDREGRLVAYKRGGASPVRVSPPIRLVQFPLQPGSTWAFQYAEDRPAGRAEFSSRVTMLGWEQVEVPAGRFEAIKISQVSEVEAPAFPGQEAHSKIVRNYWYSPMLAGVVRAETLEVGAKGGIVQDVVSELDSFDLR